MLEDPSNIFPSLTENPLIDASKGTTEPPLEVEADLTSTVAPTIGLRTEHWRDQVVRSLSKGRIDLFDTFAPTSFAFALLRPRHLLAQRILLGVAGKLMVHIENQEHFSALQKLGRFWGRFHFDDRCILDDNLA